MIVLGLLLVVAGLAAVAAAVVTGDVNVLLSWHHYQVRTSLVAVFLAGMGALLLVELGVMLMRGGSARRVGRWRGRRRLRELERGHARADADAAQAPDTGAPVV